MKAITTAMKPEPKKSSSSFWEIPAAEIPLYDGCSFCPLGFCLQLSSVMGVDDGLPEV